MTTGALMGYPVTSLIVSGVNSGWWVDNLFGYAYQTSGLSGLRMWDIWPNGSELRAETIADLGTDTIFTPQCFTFNSQLLAVNSSASNNSSQLFFNRATLNLVGTFGTNGSFGPSGATGIKCPVNMCAIQDSAGQDYIVTTGVVERTTVNCIHVQAKVNHNLGTIDEHAAVIGSVPDGSGFVAYVLGYPDTTTGVNAGSCGLYKATNAGLVKLGTIAPTAVDATWTTGWTNFYGIAIDQTDGNPIVGVATTAARATCAYLVKLDKATAAVLWAVPVGATGVGLTFDSQDMRQAVIKNGTFYYLGGLAESLYTVNTIAGTATMALLNNATLDPLHTQQVSEDVTGSIFWWGAWAEATSHPAYLGQYCLVQGNHSGSAMGWRYWPNGAPVPPPAYAIPDMGRKRAWNMILDGHSFYVLDLGDQGTFAYDDISSSWCKFITFGYNQWNLVNGVMWDQRIVGGDLLTSTVWECQPGALGDNGGAIDIQHVCMGGLVKRTRTFTSNSALRLSVSVGQLDDQTGAAQVTLSFSDDQGKTWTTVPSIALTEADYSGEIAWRGLGSFAAPGRLYRIIDVGGFVRIDGCDAELDNFDEDNGGGQE